MRKISMAVLVGLFFVISACGNDTPNHLTVRRNNDAENQQVIAAMKAEITSLRAQLQTALAQKTVEVAQAPTAPFVEGQSTIIMVNPGESLRGVGAEFDPFIPPCYRSSRGMCDESQGSWTDIEEITDEHFPPQRGRKASVVLVPLHLHRKGERRIDSEEAQKRMAALRSPNAQQGFRPATVRELREFAKIRPGIPRNSFLVALGSKWVDFALTLVPYYERYHGPRHMNLLSVAHLWEEDDLFLAARN